MPGPLILPPWPPWLGAHSCLRGHIWLVVIRAFVASQANVTITLFFVGQIIKYTQWIILGFGSNEPPLKQKLWLKYARSNFWDLNKINLIYALLLRIQLCRDYAFFWGVFLAKIWWRGALKHFNGPGSFLSWVILEVVMRAMVRLTKRMAIVLSFWWQLPSLFERSG